MQRSADSAFEPIAPQSPIVLHVPDRRFNGTAPKYLLFNPWRYAPFLPAAPNRDAGYFYAPIPLIDKDRFGWMIGQDADLFNGLGQGVTLIGIAGHAAHPNHEPFLVRRGHRDFDAKFEALANLAFGDAFDFGRMQAVQLVFVFLLLSQHALDALQNRFSPRGGGCVLAIQLAVNVAPDATNSRTQGFERGFHALTAERVRNVLS